MVRRRGESENDAENEVARLASGGGSGRGRRAAGAGSGGSGGEFKAGQNVVCKILKQVPGGYDVLVLKGNLNGFLPTTKTISPGTKVIGQFVCFHAERLLLSARFDDAATD